MCYRLIIQSAFKALQYAGVDELDKFLNSNYGSMRIGVQMSTSLEGTQPIKCGPMKTLHNDTCKYLVCHPSPKRGVTRTEQRPYASIHPFCSVSLYLAPVVLTHMIRAALMSPSSLRIIIYLCRRRPPGCFRRGWRRFQSACATSGGGGDLLLHWPAGARHQSTRR